ncbi:MAG: site-specific integrase, partial [Actinomycetota bacterium]|nr:site-specific integrase [Actinomycetota bacterium]
MTSPNGIPVPKLVRDALRLEGAYDFGLGVVLRAPTDRTATGASASYRVEYRVEPVVPGRPLSRRKEAYARDLDKAYAKAEAKFAEMNERVGGTYVAYATDLPFGDVVEQWYASPHPRWGVNYPSKVRSLIRCWITGSDITIPRARGGAVPIADIPIGALTANDYNQALEHVRRARAHRTYTEVHGLVVQIIKWAVANRFLRSTDLTITHQMPLAVSDQDTVSGRGSARAVPEEEIPPPEQIDALADTALELFGHRLRMQIYLLAYTGMRISECLALRNDDRFVLDGRDGCWRIHIREQVHKSKPRTLPPKWRKTRWAFVPHWLSAELSELLDGTGAGAPLFASPGRKVRGPEDALRRVGRGLHPYNNWRERRWEPIAERTPGWPEREDWWPPDAGTAPAGAQSQRRWQWSAHSLRHAAATYQLNVLGLDPDDVAKFLGHRSGVQVWEMYVRVRP